MTDPASPLRSVVRVGVLTLTAFAIAAGRTQVPRWMVGVIIYSTALFLLRDNSDQLSYVFVFALVPLLWSVPERRMVRALTWASIFSLLLIFAFLQAGITHNVTLDYRERATFGTKGVPFFFNVVYGAAAMAILYTFKYRSRWRFLVLGGCLVIATYLFRQTDARGGYYSLVLFVVLLGVVPLAARWRPFRAGMALLPIIFFGVSFVIASLWRSAHYEKLLSYRPWLLHAFLDNVSLADFVLSRTVKQFDEFVTQVRNGRQLLPPSPRGRGSPLGRGLHDGLRLGSASPAQAEAVRRCCLPGRHFGVLQLREHHAQDRERLRRLRLVSRVAQLPMVAGELRGDTGHRRNVLFGAAESPRDRDLTVTAARAACLPRLEGMTSATRSRVIA